MENRAFKGYYMEHFPVGLGLVGMERGVSSDLEEVRCLVWFNEYLKIMNTKKLKHGDVETLGDLLLDKKMKLFIDQQLISLQEEAEAYYKQEIAQASKKFQEYIAEKFDVLEQKIKQQLEESEHESAN